MSYWQMSDEEKRETDKSLYDPIVKFSYTNQDKIVKPSSEKKLTQKSSSVSDIREDKAENNGLHLGLSTESFYSALKPHYTETRTQNGGTYIETHFSGSYDFHGGSDDSRQCPNMDGSFRDLFCPREKSNISTNNAKNILFEECTYEERQDEINRLLRNNAKNEKFIHVSSDEVPQDINNSSLVSYRKISNNIACEGDCISAPVTLGQPFAPLTSEKTCSSKHDSTPGIPENRYSSDSGTFEADFFPKMTPTAVEKVKKGSVENLSEQNAVSRADSPMDFLSLRAFFESNNNSAEVYKNNTCPSVKISKTPSTLKSTSDKNGGNNVMVNCQGSVKIPSRSSHRNDTGSSKMEYYIGNNKQTIPSDDTGFISSPRQSAVGSRTTTNITQSHQSASSNRSAKDSAQSYQKGVHERNQKKSTNLSRYGTSVQEEKLLRQAAASSRKSEKKLGDTFAAHDDDKSSDYESLCTSMETVIDCSTLKTSERCSSVDTGIPKIGKYNKRVADIVRMFDEMEVKQHIPDGYYTWQDYKMSKFSGFSRWDDPLTNAGLSKSYSNITELQLTDSPRSRSECCISELSNSFEASASQNWFRPKSVDMFESARNVSRHQEQSYDIVQTRENTPSFKTNLNYDLTPSQEKNRAAQDDQSSVSSNLVSNPTQLHKVTREKQVNNSLFHDERRSAFERHTSTKPEPDHHYENVSYSSAPSSKNSFRTERNESSFINTQRMSNLVNQTEPTFAEKLNEEDNNGYVTCTVMQSRLTPLGDLTNTTEESGRSRSSARTESSLVEKRDKSVVSKPKVVTWGANKTLTTSRFRSHSADPYEMTRKSAMGSKTSSGSNMNLESWRMSSPEPSPHFLNLTADAKRQSESYYVNSDQRLLNILFENLMENKYLNRSSKLKQNQDVVEQSKFIRDKNKEISQIDETNYLPMTKSITSVAASGMKSLDRPISPRISEMITSSPSVRPHFSEINSNKARTWKNFGDDSHISKHCTITKNQTSATYGVSDMRTSRCDSPRSESHIRSCRLVSSPVNVGAAKIRLHDGQSRRSQAETKPASEINTTVNAIQDSTKMHYNSSCRSTDSSVVYPWGDEGEMVGNPSSMSKIGMVGSSSYNSNRDMVGSSAYNLKRKMVGSSPYNYRKEMIGSPFDNSKRARVWSPSYMTTKMARIPSYNLTREMIGSPSYNSTREIVLNPSYNMKSDLGTSLSYNSKIEMVGSSSVNSRTDVVGSPSRISKREHVWSPPCNYPLAPFRTVSPASSIAFDDRAFSPRGTSPFRVISPSQGNSVVNMQTLSRSESALSARNTPQSESCVLRFISGNTDGMGDIEYRKQLYLKSVEMDSSTPVKCPANVSPVPTIPRNTAQQDSSTPVKCQANVSPVPTIQRKTAQQASQI